MYNYIGIAFEGNPTHCDRLRFRETLGMVVVYDGSRTPCGGGLWYIYALLGSIGPAQSLIPNDDSHSFIEEHVLGCSEATQAYAVGVRTAYRVYSSNNCSDTLRVHDSHPDHTRLPQRLQLGACWTCHDLTSSGPFFTNSGSPSYPSTFISFRPSSSFCSQVLSYITISMFGSGSGA